MKFAAPSILSAMTLSASVALAGDLDVTAKARVPAFTPWDIGFGAALMTDYNVRGITQSARKPSFTAYFEPRYKVGSNLQLYAGLSGERIDFPNRAATQVDVYAGLRPSFDKLAFDFGLWRYHHPGGTIFNGLSGAASCTTKNVILCNTMKGDVTFWELYAKATYAINDALSVGGNVYYSPSVLNSGAPAAYASITAKIIVPTSIFPRDIGAFVSGEFGRYRQGTTDAFYGVPAFPSGIKLPDYTTWNVGLILAYKTFTLDLRYYDTNLSKANCNVLTGDYTAVFGGAVALTPTNPSGLVSNWCSAALIAKLSFDATFASWK